MENRRTAKETMKRLFSVLGCIVKMALYYIILVGHYLIAALVIAIFVPKEQASLLQLLDKAVTVLNDNTALVYVILSSLSMLSYYYLFIRKSSSHAGERSSANIQINTSMLLAFFSMAISLIVNMIYCIISWNDDGEVIELSWVSFVLYVIGTVITAPVIEEMLFRKVLLTGLRNCVSVKTAIVFSSVLFGLMHGSVFDFVYTFIFGMLLGTVYCKFDSIIYPIIMHIAFNLMAILIQTIQFPSILLCWISIVLGIAVCVCTWSKIRSIYNGNNKTVDGTV